MSTDANGLALAQLANQPPYRTEFYNFCVGQNTTNGALIGACLQTASTIGPQMSAQKVPAARLGPWLLGIGLVGAAVVYAKRRRS